ncbi:hypothetical protein VPH35_003832 [Triticum aestivum]|uniref:Uncharacterized protein n=1 Tax=Triticum turgidum subsp. durum TaxID=4567 RepID=A0A9R0UZQ9_TRITD|nr:unnamed protein product [Triticum turgidum subsp. durum]
MSVCKNLILIWSCKDFLQAFVEWDAPPPPPAWSQQQPRVSTIGVAIRLCPELDGSPADKRLFVSPLVLCVARHRPRSLSCVIAAPSSMSYLKRECLACFMYCLKTTSHAIFLCFMYCLNT